MRFSLSVEVRDVQEALRLVQTALRQAATDPRTGVIDMDVIATGTSRAARSLLGTLVRARMPLKSPIGSGIAHPGFARGSSPPLLLLPLRL